MIGELSSRSEVFRTLWAAHDVGHHATGSKRFRHPDVGLLELDYEVMPLPGEGRLMLVAYTAASGTPSADSLALLASLAADPQGTSRPIESRPRRGGPTSGRYGLQPDAADASDW